MSKKLKQMLAAYGLVLPSFLTVMLVVAWPILTAIKTSFTLSLIHISEPTRP